MRVITLIGLTDQQSQRLAVILRDEYGVPTVPLSDIAKAYVALEREEAAQPPKLNVTQEPTGYQVSEKRLAQHGRAHFLQRAIEALDRDGWEWDTILMPGELDAADIVTLKEHFGPDFLIITIARDGTHPGGNGRLQTALSYADVIITNAPDSDTFEQQLLSRLAQLLLTDSQTTAR